MPEEMGYDTPVVDWPCAMVVDDFPASTTSTPSDHHLGHEASSLVSSMLPISSDMLFSDPVLPYLLPDYYNDSNPYDPYPQLTSSVTVLTI